MADEPQNLIPEENSIPVSPQEPILDAPILPSTSEPVAMPPLAPESPIEAESAVPLNNDNVEITLPEAQNPVLEQTPKDSEAAYGSGGQEQVISPTPTAQMAGNEPFDQSHDKPLAEPETKNYQPESEPQIPTETYKNHTHENLAKAQLTIQEKKRKKLEKIIEALNTKVTITNDEVEKLLHVSDATATRYLEQLEKEGKIKQSGRTGQDVSYSKI